MNSLYYPEIDNLLETLNKEKSSDQYEYFNQKAKEAEMILSKLKRPSPLKVEVITFNNSNASIDKKNMPLLTMKKDEP